MMIMTRTRKKRLDQARQTMSSGHYLPVRARGDAIRVLVVAVDHTREELAQRADELSWIQLDRPFIKPIVLLNSADAAAFRRRGFAYETAVDRETWAACDARDGSYDRYVESRIAEMNQIYHPRHTVIAAPGQELPGWAFQE